MSVCVFLRSTRQLGESISVLHVIVCIGFCSFAAICYFLYITNCEHIDFSVISVTFPVCFIFSEVYLQS